MTNLVGTGCFTKDSISIATDPSLKSLSAATMKPQSEPKAEQLLGTQSILVSSAVAAVRQPTMTLPALITNPHTLDVNRSSEQTSNVPYRCSQGHIAANHSTRPSAAQAEAPSKHRKTSSESTSPSVQSDVILPSRVKPMQTVHVGTKVVSSISTGLVSSTSGGAEHSGLNGTNINSNNATSSWISAANLSHHQHNQERELGSGEENDNVESKLRARRLRWATLLTKRPDANDADRMSAWLLEVMAVSDFGTPLRSIGMSSLTESSSSLNDYSSCDTATTYQRPIHTSHQVLRTEMTLSSESSISTRTSSSSSCTGSVSDKTMIQKKRREGAGSKINEKEIRRHRRKRTRMEGACRVG